MRCLISASALDQQFRLGGSAGVSVQGINGFLRVAGLNRSWSERLQRLLAQGGVRIVVLESLKNLVGFCGAPQIELGLRGPIQSVFAKERVILCLQQPA